MSFQATRPRLGKLTWRRAAGRIRNCAAACAFLVGSSSGTLGAGATMIQQAPQALGAEPDAAAAARRAQADAVRKSIAGREAEPATAVFSNVKVLTTSISAGQLINAMDVTFGRFLGVGCDYCHVAGDFASDTLRTKRVAREMMRINGIINAQFSQVADLPERTTASCWTCHRGSAHPPKAPSASSS